MPAIYLFRRRTFLAGDDLQPAAYLTMGARLFQLLVLLTPLYYEIIIVTTTTNKTSSSSSTTCREQGQLYGMLLALYAVASTIYCIAESVCVESQIARWSAVGAPWQTQPRHAKVAHLLEIRLVPYSIVLALVIVAGACTVATMPAYYRCHYRDQQQQYYDQDADNDNDQHDDGGQMIGSTSTIQLWWFALGLLLLMQISEVVVAWLFLISLCQQPPVDDDTIDYDYEYPYAGCESGGDGAETTTTIETGGATTTDPLRRSITPPVSQNQQREVSYRQQVNQQQQQQQHHRHHNHELMEEMWANRCAVMCQCLSSASCYLFGGRDLAHATATSVTTPVGAATAATRSAASREPAAAFTDVARALADYFEASGVLDVVPSDIMIGFVLLQRLQKQRLLTARRVIVGATATIADNEEEDDASPAFVEQRTHSLLDDEKCEPTPLSPPITTATDAPPGSAQRRRRQEQQQQRIRQRPQQPPHNSVYRRSLDGSSCLERVSRQLLVRANYQDTALLQEGERYAKYALAIYTWPLFMYVHPFTGAPRLLCAKLTAAAASCSAGAGASNSSLFCCYSGNHNDTTSRDLPDDENIRFHQYPQQQGSNAPMECSHNSNNNRIKGDNICETHKSALLLTAGLTETELVYAQLESSFRDNPYAIVLDHAWRSVVVTIRGTFSLEDCVTDVLIEPESLQRQLGIDCTPYVGQQTDDDPQQEQFCHGGVMACVQNVYRDLQQHGWLDRLMLAEGAPYPDYTLRLTGHSLGAATCTVLSFMLKERFPTLRVINYSPPGCALTWEMAIACKQWCTSFVMDSDLVPRLSIASMERLRDETLQIIGRIKINKMDVARRVVGGNSSGDGDGGNGFCCARELNLDDNLDELTEVLDEVLHPVDQMPDSEYKRQLSRFQSIQEERRQSRVHRQIKLYPPGRLIHVVETSERATCVHGVIKCLTCCTSNVGSKYTPVYIQNDDLNEIVVTSTMGTDHFPNRICDILGDVANDYGVSS